MKGLLLLSGGFDSPVAGYLMQKKGVEVIALHLSSKLVTDEESVRKVEKLSEKLGFSKLIVKDISQDLIKISKTCKRSLYFVLMKRLMYRIAGELANQEGCQFIITGENLGQVSSQTLQNLIVIDKASSLPVTRPLIGLDKQEIINLAEEIGTFEISKGKEHCDALGPQFTETRARLEEVLNEEKKLL